MGNKEMLSWGMLWICLLGMKFTEKETNSFIVYSICFTGFLFLIIKWSTPKP
jgi:hypothetical protein